MSTYHERLSIVRKMINESKASIVGVLLLRPPARQPRQPPAMLMMAVSTMAQSDVQPLILRPSFQKSTKLRSLAHIGP